MLIALFWKLELAWAAKRPTLFAAELLRMYQRYAQKRGWQSSLLDINYSSLGGVREAVLEITGEGVEILKNEGGVHRVQRIPATEKSGRVHTSTVSVAVMSRPKEAKIDIKPEDFGNYLLSILLALASKC